MGGQAEEKKPVKHICMGLLAHVDAGKTTLAESLLYKTGSIRKLGRVDHQDAFLDTDEMERARGITIFSKQACIALGDYEVTLLDTPGHVDFSAEMERTLQVLDYAVVVISGADGVQGHVETLWRLLKRYRIPTFLFVNKMDQEGTETERLMKELQSRLDEGCVLFSDAKEEGGKQPDFPADFWENIAMCEDALLERYLEGEPVGMEEVAELVRERKVFPCFFGSALKLFGVDELLWGLRTLMKPKEYPDRFGARIFKITRDEQGNRLTHMKITGGSLKVKMLLSNRREESGGEEVWEEKADQVRIYSGDGYRSVPEAEAGSICAVTGLTKTFAGQGLGTETEPVLPVLEPVLTYRIGLPEDCDVHGMFLKLKQLEEEEPELSVVWEENSGEIHAQVMGEVQMEVLKHQIRERFGVWAEFGEGSIVYRETIENRVEGVGHFEPLRHYAEVHLCLEPLERGAGLQFASSCSEDVLDKNWQRLVLTHLEEKKHKGVLIGAEITDMKITLLTGRAHIKHTEGGDFRQATYRALRQGLMQAKGVILEPVYDFRLEVPAGNMGRAMTDIQRMKGRFDTPRQEGEFSVLTGSAPVVNMRGYQREVTAYTKGRGRLACTLRGYEPCHNPEEVLALAGYDPEGDTENPSGSVFCAHGAGFVVPWDQAARYMHLESCLKPEKEEETVQTEGTEKQPASRREGALPESVSEEELEEIFNRTYGTVKREKNGYKKRNQGAVSRTFGKTSTTEKAYVQKSDAKPAEEYLLVDGYNIIFAWEDLRELSKVNIESARNKLMDVLCNYQGFHRCTLILVFDAYRVEGGQGSVQKYHNIHVVFTKEAETADQYIEKTVHKIGHKATVTVATSDALEQVIIYGQGARRMSARELWDEVELTQKQIRETWEKKQGEDSQREESHGSGKNYLFDHLPEELTEMVEQVRPGKKEWNDEN